MENISVQIGIYHCCPKGYPGAQNNEGNEKKVILSVLFSDDWKTSSCTIWLEEGQKIQPLYNLVNLEFTLESINLILDICQDINAQFVDVGILSVRIYGVSKKHRLR